VYLLSFGQLKKTTASQLTANGETTMRIPFWGLLCVIIVAGCAKRDAPSARNPIALDPEAGATELTDSPRTTADRNMTASSGSATAEGAGDVRTERTVARPVLPDSEDEPKPDNTGVNRRDADGELTSTPVDQGQSPKDIETTAAIRKRVTDTEISVNGQNVKIITKDGKVILRGPVETEDEKQMIERIALEIAGEGKVENHLEVEGKE
jgi:osmotically-inducible protein OsmY